MKNILIISSSPRRNGNSDTLAEEFARGARERGNKVKKVFLADKNIGYCTGCGACVSSVVCSQNDDMSDLIDDMQNADVVVFATPVYFYTMCGQMKTFIDRLCPAYESLGNKDYYIIATAAETEKNGERIRRLLRLSGQSQRKTRNTRNGRMAGGRNFREVQKTGLRHRQERLSRPTATAPPSEHFGALNL